MCSKCGLVYDPGVKPGSICGKCGEPLIAIPVPKVLVPAPSLVGILALIALPMLSVVIGWSFSPPMVSAIVGLVCGVIVLMCTAEDSEEKIDL